MACLFDLENRGVRQVLLHPDGVEAAPFLKQAEIPDFFEAIVSYPEEGQSGWLEALHRLCEEPYERNVCVTDGTDPSPQEVRAQLPGILIATPDTLELLGWEKLA
jgi:hypothetical protein